MREQTFNDAVVRCVGCHATFHWTAEDQRLARLRDWWPLGTGARPPARRCPACRRVKAKCLAAAEPPTCPGCGESGSNLIAFDTALRLWACSVCSQRWRA